MYSIGIKKETFDKKKSQDKFKSPISNSGHVDLLDELEGEKKNWFLSFLYKKKKLNEIESCCRKKKSQVFFCFWRSR